MCLSFPICSCVGPNMHKWASGWEGTVRIWVGNDNVVRGLARGLGVEREGAVWARLESWFGSALEEGGSWVGGRMVISGGQLTSCWGLRMQGKVEANWVRRHADKRATRRVMGKHESLRGNVKVDANCTTMKRVCGAG